MPGLGGGSLAAVARVAMVAETGEFNSDIARSEAIFRNATRDMSDESLRLELAQDKLRRSLAKGPAAFREQARAELQVRNAERALRGETDATTRSLDRQQRELSQSARGALLGTGAFRSLGRSVAFASAGFLGGAGLVYGMRAAISVASSLEEQTNKVQATFRDSGQEVVDWSRTTSTSMGIAQDKALAYAGTIGGILNASGLARAESARWSREIVGLAADMASFNDSTPEEALEALRSGLVGETEPLRRFQVLLSAARVEQEAYASGIAKTGEKLTEGQKVQARYNLILKGTVDQQGDYAKTADSLANSQRTLSALWREAQGLVGQALAPAYTDAVQGLRDWLAVQENQEQLQRTVNALVGDAEKIVRGFAGGLRVVKNAASPVVEAMGGIENAVRAATLLWVAFKVKAILGFAGTALASRTTATRMVADAAVAGRAWDVATRPRVLPVTTIPGGGGPPVPTPDRDKRDKRDRSFGYFNPVTAIVVGAAAAAYFGIKSGQADAVDAGEFEKLKQAARQGKLTGSMLEEGRQFLTDEQYRALRQILANRSRRGAAERPGDRAEGAANLPPAGLTPRPTRTGAGTGRRTLADIELDIARPGNEMGELREKRSFIQRQIDALEARKNLNDKQKATLAGLYGDLAGTQSQLDSIIDEGEQKIADQRADAAEKRDAAREQAATRLRDRIAGREETLANQQAAAELTKRLSDDRKAIRNRIAFYREMGRNKQLEASERRDYVGKTIAAQKELQDLNEKETKAREDAEDKAFTAFERRTRERDLRSTEKLDALSGFGGGLGAAQAYKRGVKRDAGAEKGLTEADVRRMQFEFMTQLTGEIGQYGSNFDSDSGQIATQSHMQTQLLQQQNAALHRLVEGSWHPGAQLASADLSAADWGVGY